MVTRVLAVGMLALAVAPSALGARAAVPPAPTPGLLSIGAYDTTLLQLTRGSAAPEDGTLISGTLGIWRVPTPTAQRILPRLLARGVVKAVEPDCPLELFRTEFEPFQGEEYWRSLVGADAAVPPGPGKPVTVLDTGVDLSHPEFVGRPNMTILGTQSLGDSGDDFHGTAVSSVVGAPENGVGLLGVYPQAVLRSVDVRGLRTSDVVLGLGLAIQAGPSVINMSFGVPSSQLLRDSVAEAFRTGSILVAAAGNERQQRTPIAAPANLNHVLTIAATDQENRVAGFSTPGSQVDLSAPGVGIMAAVPLQFGQSGYDTFDGTSFSAPIVSGATAWVWTVRPQLDNTQVFDLIRVAAADLEAPGFDRDTGYGLLDIPAALTEPAPFRDPQEPNEDIREVRPNGLFRTPTPGVTGPGRPSANLRARLDLTEDPEDVYRVFVPAGRTVRVRVTPDTDVDVDLWKPTATSVFLRGSARAKSLFGTSGRSGRATETVSARNRTKVGFYAYLDVYLPRSGPGQARYTVSVSTVRP